MPIIVPSDKTLVPVRIMVNKDNGAPLTSTTGTEVKLSDLMASSKVAAVGATGTITQQAAQANSAAADVAAVNVQFNNLLAKLRSAGVIAT